MNAQPQFQLKKETLFSETETTNSKQLAILKANFPQCFDKNGASFRKSCLRSSNHRMLNSPKNHTA